MKIYCSCCDLTQPVLIDQCKDSKTGELYEDIVCVECKLVIASGTGIKQAMERTSAWRKRQIKEVNE